jgi:hypothetical protein
MSRGNSGRIVIEVDPQAKHKLYEALAKEGSTLKDWFLKVAEEYCEYHVQPQLFAKKIPRQPKKSK